MMKDSSASIIPASPGMLISRGGLDELKTSHDDTVRLEISRASSCSLFPTISHILDGLGSQTTATVSNGVEYTPNFVFNVRLKHGRVAQQNGIHCNDDDIWTCNYFCHCQVDRSILCVKEQNSGRLLDDNCLGE